MKWPRMLAAPTIAVGSFVVLLTAVLLGVSISPVRMYPPFGNRARLGTTLERTGVAPLTDRFVDQVLGPGAASSGPILDPVGSRVRDAFGGAEDAAGEEVVHPFTNNDHANAYHVTRLPFTGRTSTADADREAGEPECGTQLGGTVWYHYTATHSEALLADTFGTGYQTSLAAYRQSVRGPAPLENACDFDPQGNSQIRIEVSSGTTYLFQIGAAVRGGALTFHLKRFGSTMLASVSTEGQSGNAASTFPSVSFDSRYVAFSSRATNLVFGMGATCNGCDNVFLRDRQAGTTRLVSIALGGTGGNGYSSGSQVSEDGRYVAFHSIASNLVAGDSNDLMDVFVRDMRTGRTERVSLSEHGEQDRSDVQAAQLKPAGGLGTLLYGSLFSAMSADGSEVAFESRSPHLVDGDNDQARDIFVRDRRNGTTRLVSLGNGETQSPLDVQLDSISRNGRWIVFLSRFPMSADDVDASQDLFVRDLWTGRTELVSVPQVGHELEGIHDAVRPNNTSQRSISDDGRFVVFGSDGALVDGDTNNVVDVFVRDRLRQTTERVSVSSSGGEGIGATTSSPINSGEGDTNWAISADGQTVAFTTDLNSLEPSDLNNANDVFLHDRSNKATLRISASGDVAGGLAPRISGDGMHTVFFGSYPLSLHDTNAFDDIFVYSPLAAEEWFSPDLGCTPGRGVVCPGSGGSPGAAEAIPAAPCEESSEYTNVGLAGAHEDVTPSLIPYHFRNWPEETYAEDSVVRFKYRIDVSGSSVKPSAQATDVTIALRWDNSSDFDLYVSYANGEPLTFSYKPFGESEESVFLPQLPQCTDLRVDVVNSTGLPPTKMTLDTTLGGLK
jgi:WD40 repeat protein